MDYIQPPDQIAEVVAIAEVKANLTIPAMLIRGALSGAILGFAILFAWRGTLTLEPTLGAIVGSLVFPAGFVMISLLGLELATGNYAIVTLGWLQRKVSFGRLIRNFVWVGIGNFMGSVLFAYLFAYVVTNGQMHGGDPFSMKIIRVAQEKILFYYEHGAEGFWTAFVKGVLCNVLVGLAAVLGLTSRSSIGRIASMWFPVAIFFGLGLEHSVVNMFIIPMGLMLGANIPIHEWLSWNFIPVTLGNMIGAGIIVAGGLHFSTPKRTE